MASRGGYPFRGCKSPGIFVLVGSFNANGASAPTSISGAGFTVSAPVAGVYTITLNDPAVNIVHGEATLWDTAANSTARALISANAVFSRPATFAITTQSTAGTDANLASGTVSFVLFLRDTTATR